MAVPANMIRKIFYIALWMSLGAMLGGIVGANTHRYEFQHATSFSVLRCDKWSGTVEKVFVNN